MGITDAHGQLQFRVLELRNQSNQELVPCPLLPSNLILLSWFSCRANPIENIEPSRFVNWWILSPCNRRSDTARDRAKRLWPRRSSMNWSKTIPSRQPTFEALRPAKDVTNTTPFANPFRMKACEDHPPSSTTDELSQWKPSIGKTRLPSSSSKAFPQVREQSSPLDVLTEFYLGGDQSEKRRTFVSGEKKDRRWEQRRRIQWSRHK